MQRPLLFSFSLFAASGLLAQSTAQDFTLDDCAGSSHQLFSELDAGTIVILEFAMIPSCAPCIQAGSALSGMLADYELTNPGVVKYYAWAFNDANTCAQMESWELDHGISPSATFIDGSSMVNYYGGMYMPTIVILAGTDHAVIGVHHGWFGSTDDDIQADIDAYLATGIQETGMTTSATLSPNPAQEQMTLAIDLTGASDVSLAIVDASGRTMKSWNNASLSAGHHDLLVNVNELGNGRYVLLLSGSFGERRIPFQVMR